METEIRQSGILWADVSTQETSLKVQIWLSRKINAGVHGILFVAIGMVVAEQATGTVVYRAQQSHNE